MIVGEGGTGIRIDVGAGADILLKMLVEQMGERLLDPASTDRVPQLNTEFNRLHDRIDWSRYLHRDMLLCEIRNMARERYHVWLHGPPGSGKTYALAGLGKSPDVRYVSLKRKTLQQVAAQLIGRQAGFRGRKPVLAFSDGEALAALQEELSTNSATLLLDDAEHNIAVVKSFASLDPNKCALIFISRVPLPPTLAGMATLAMPSLSRGEVDRFLSLSGISLPPGEFEDVYQRAAGNFLYLVCVCTHTLSPLPSSLDIYHQALFEELEPRQQEIVSFLALSRDQLQLADIHALLTGGKSIIETPSETRHLIAETRPLVEERSVGLKIFHPSFADFVRAKLRAEGIATIYHHRLGELAVSREAVVAAAHHFLSACDPRADELLLDAAHLAYIQGDLTAAQSFAERRAQLALEHNDRQDEASTRLLLANVLRSLGQLDDAIAQAGKSLELWEDERNSSGSIISRVWLNILVLERGDIDDAIHELERLHESTRGRDDIVEGMVELNRSFYMLHRVPREALGSAQRAFALFDNAKHDLGASLSLTNIAAAHGQLNDFAMQHKFATEALAACRRSEYARGEAAALNNLASATRHLGDLAEAENRWRESIEVCHRYQFVEAKLVNIACLGNTLKDAGNRTAARAAYQETLTESRRLDLSRSEAYALELLGRLDIAEGNLEAAIAHLHEALKRYPGDADRIRLAAIYDALGDAHSKLGRSSEANIYFSQGGEHYERAQMFADAASSYYEAANSCYRSGDTESGYRGSIASLRCALAAANGDTVVDVLQAIPENLNKVHVASAYLRAIKSLCSLPSPVLPRKLIIGLVHLARRLPTEQGRDTLQKCLGIVVAAIRSDAERALARSLAFAIEQSPDELLSIEFLTSVSESLSSRIQQFYFHRSTDGLLGWTIGISPRIERVVQFVGDSEQLVAPRVAFALALLVFFDRERFESLACQFGTVHEHGWRMFVLSQESFERHILGRSGAFEPAGPMAATVTASNVPKDERQPPSMLILHQDYDLKSNLERHPNNKEFVWVVMSVARAFVNHFTHTAPDDLPDLARACRMLCEQIFISDEQEGQVHA